MHFANWNFGMEIIVMSQQNSMKGQNTASKFGIYKDADQNDLQESKTM